LHHFLGNRKSLELSQKLIDEKIAELKAGVRKKKNVKARIAKFLLFEKFKADRNIHVTDENVVMDFLAAHLLKTGTAKSVRGVLSQIRIEHGLRKLPFLTADETVAVMTLIKQMELMDTTPTKRVLALPRDTIQQFTSSLNLNDLEERSVAVIINMGQNGLLRGIEATGRNSPTEQGALVADFLVKHDHSSVDILLDRTKTHRSGPRLIISIPAVAEPGQWDAVSLIDLHLAIDNHGADLSAPMFPSFVTTGWLRSWLKRLAKRHGINPNLVGKNFV